MNLLKESRKHKTLNTVTPNPTQNQIKKMQNTAQFLEQKILFHTNINKKKIPVKQFVKSIKNGPYQKTQ